MLLAVALQQYSIPYGDKEDHMSAPAGLAYSKYYLINNAEMLSHKKDLFICRIACRAIPIY